MASVVERLKKRNARGTSSTEWSRSGSFLHKPERGWIHPDEQLAMDGGICYGVRYIGCLEVKESMRALDFDTRTALAREAINRVAEAAGLKTASKKRKIDKKIGKMLSDNPSMQFAGSNVNLTITTESINLMVMESGEIIANHLMPGISFASGGDAETLDFVAYVAKDEFVGRACHVLECGGGLSEDVITTIGQAFELRFKEYLKKQPKPVLVPDRSEATIQEGDAWGEENEEDENEYYNDNPNARPPSPPSRPRMPSEYATPPSNMPVGDRVYMSVKEPSTNGYVYDTAKDLPLIDFTEGSNATYDNSRTSSECQPFWSLMSCRVTRQLIRLQNVCKEDGAEGGASKEETDPAQAMIYDNHELKNTPVVKDADPFDPFDMQPFNASLNDKGAEASGGGTFSRTEASRTSQTPNSVNANPPKRVTPLFEEWFHGNLNRKEAEKLLQNDGDFLVRQSSADTNQFVLSGRQGGAIKHLLLVDPEGVVRTKDHTFESVPHLINFHRTQDIPIVSQESELHLKRPISNKLTAC